MRPSCCPIESRPLIALASYFGSKPAPFIGNWTGSKLLSSCAMTLGRVNPGLEYTWLPGELKPVRVFAKPQRLKLLLVEREYLKNAKFEKGELSVYDYAI